MAAMRMEIACSSLVGNDLTAQTDGLLGGGLGHLVHVAQTLLGEGTATMIIF